MFYDCWTDHSHNVGITVDWASLFESESVDVDRGEIKSYSVWCLKN